MRAVYAGRRRVMRAADIGVAAHLSDEIDRAIATASQAVDSLCNRGDDTRPGFAPWTGTITYDWPTQNNGTGYRFYLNRNSLVSLTSAVSGGVTITADCLLRPETGPPYGKLDVDRSSASSLTIGDTGAGQGSLSITGVWCGAAVRETTSSAWTAASMDDSVTAVTLAAPLDVGAIIRLDSERMIVTGQSWTDSGQTGTLAAQKSAQSLAVSDGSAFFTGEELILDSERVLVLDITGNTLTVQRAAGGSTLAAHTGTAIFYTRLCEVERGALGTTAAAHTGGARIYLFTPPPLVEQLTVAYALDQRAQESADYVRTIGSGDNERQAGGGGIARLEDRVWAAHGRKLRHRAV